MKDIQNLTPIFYYYCYHCDEKVPYYGEFQYCCVKCNQLNVSTNDIKELYLFTSKQ